MTNKEPISIAARRAERGGPAWYVQVRYTSKGELAGLDLASAGTTAEGMTIPSTARSGDLLFGPFPTRGLAAAALDDMAAQVG